MRRVEKDSTFYDSIYRATPDYWKHYTQSVYYPCWAIIADRMRGAEMKSILDIGCGPGQFAELLKDHGFRDYKGLDFSSVAIKLAKDRCPGYRFIEANAGNFHYLRTLVYDTIVMTEFLEHVEGDLGILQNIQSGARVCATVPNFLCDGHVRRFDGVEAVQSRYGHFFDDFDVTFLWRDTTARYFIFEGVRK